MSNVYYKIRRRRDGLFSCGGTYGRFDKRGKVWTNLGHIKNHLNQFKDSGAMLYADCELVTFSMVEIECSPVLDMVALQKERREERERERTERHQEYKEKRDREQLAKLLAEYGAPDRPTTN